METFKGKIRAISSQGLGVVDHPEGRVYFVRGTWPGDEGEFQIERQEKKYGFAKIVSLTSLSKDRINNPCPHSGLNEGDCGGCPWLGISYDKQLEQKQIGIQYMIERTGAFEKEYTKVLPIYPSPLSMGYRNRAQFKTDGTNLGFVSPGTKALAPINDCLVLNNKTRELLSAIKSKLPNPEWKPSEKYLWSYIEVDSDMNPNDIAPNKRRPFKQANDEQNANMKSWLKNKLDKLPKDITVLELFCGSGNFTSVISDLGFQKIIATEVDQKAVQELNEKKLPGVTAYAYNIFDTKNWKYIIDSARDAQVLVLDPPREGFEKLSHFVARLKKLKKIFYISCDPHSFATETRFLKNIDWYLDEVQPIDQFPQTPHVEVLGELTLK